MTDIHKREWVALLTFSDEDSGMFYEAGGIYDHEPPCRWTLGGRELQSDEPVVACSRCQRRFAATDDGSAESHRDLHFDGDADCPSICRGLPTRRDFKVVGRPA
jgi:hypothetical protein